MLLSLYRACSSILAPLAPLALSWRARLKRARLRREDRLRKEERLGRPSVARPSGRLAWLHAASAGEIESLLPLIDRLAAAGFHVLTTTRDDADAPSRPKPPALHQFAPLDAPSFVAGFLAFWRPDVALLAGAEFWPNLIAEALRRGVPVAFVNARMPHRAFLVLRRLPRLAEALFAGVDACLARTPADARRFQSLGFLHAEAAGDPIFDFAPQPADGPALARLSARIGARPVWAAFPDDAEEDAVIEAHRRIAANFPDLVTIVAPRRTKRGFDIALRAGKLGLDARVAAREDDQGPLPAIHIAQASDAGLLYRAAGIVFLGRSLARSRKGGGINPVEAAKLGCAILHGPDVDDFADAYAALDAAGAAAVVDGAGTLASEASLLLIDAAEERAMGRAAAAASEKLGGASARIMQAISPHLAQARVRLGVDDEEEG